MNALDLGHRADFTNGIVYVLADPLLSSLTTSAPFFFKSSINLSLSWSDAPLCSWTMTATSALCFKLYFACSPSKRGQDWHRATLRAITHNSEQTCCACTMYQYRIDLLATMFIMGTSKKTEGMRVIG